MDLHRFDGEGFGGVLREHANQYLIDDLYLGAVSGCDVYEDVPCCQLDFAMF